MDVDGGGNTVSEHEFVPRPWGDDNHYGKGFDTKTKWPSASSIPRLSPNTQQANRRA
jgi:Cu2+-containing amine oxidase